MKLNYKLSIAILFFGITAFGQSTNNSENVASNQSSYNIENNLSMGIIQKDSTKVKEMRDVPWFVERYKFSFGFYGGYNNTNIQLDSKSGDAGAEVDFENDLGYNSYTSSIFTDFQWRSSSRSRFMLAYYNLRRDSSKKLEKTFDFGENTYEINTTIYSYFNVGVYRFSYGYAILSKPKYEVGLSVGAHILELQLGIGVRGDNINAEVSDNFGVTAPLPDFGIWGGYAFTDKFAVNGEFDYFAVQIDNIDGEVLSYNLSATYKLSNHFNITGGFNSLNTTIDVTGKRADARIKWGNNGLSLRAAYTFGTKKWK
ncbi:hypothetical protein ACSVH2_11650 [Flavobacterium sp. RSB2_4_14]|uniref:hypothetical protein n=1 Tax=Flavobacterium sp. RSB2_4_14 TaxID=3447665 RepID=UPI003F33A50F